MHGVARLAFVACAAFTAAQAEVGFEEFEKTTVDFTRPHTLRPGTKVCLDYESIVDLSAAPEKWEVKAPQNCYVLKRKERFRIVYVIHGYLHPEFWVEPVNRALAKGWVYREDIPD